MAKQIFWMTSTCLGHMTIWACSLVSTRRLGLTSDSKWKLCRWTCTWNELLNKSTTIHTNMTLIMNFDISFIILIQSLFPHTYNIISFFWLLFIYIHEPHKLLGERVHLILQLLTVFNNFIFLVTALLDYSSISYFFGPLWKLSRYHLIFSEIMYSLTRSVSSVLSDICKWKRQLSFLIR